MHRRIALARSILAASRVALYWLIMTDKGTALAITGRSEAGVMCQWCVNHVLAAETNDRMYSQMVPVKSGEKVSARICWSLARRLLDESFASSTSYQNELGYHHAELK